MIVLLALLACEPSPPPPEAERPLDDVLRLSHAQAKGTHNSYHLAPESTAVAEWNYSHAPLEVQLVDQGVRQVELDVHRDEDGVLRVYHIALVDAATTCETLYDCLAALNAASAALGDHLPLLVTLEPKDDAGGEPITDADWDAIERFVLAAGPEPVWPAEVRGDHATLAAAIAADGWPTLGAVRGRAVYAVIDSGAHRDTLRARGEGLFFVDADPGDDDAAWMSIDDPFDATVPDAVAAGVLVRTMTDGDPEEVRAGDTTRRDHALAVGAHFLSTDYPAEVDGVPYVVEIPGGTPARCNPVTAPADCTSEDIE